MKKQKQEHCPKCGSILHLDGELDYYGEDMIGLGWDCKKCDISGTEFHKPNFLRHAILRKPAERDAIRKRQCARLIRGYNDKNNIGNSGKYHTGKECAEVGCNNPAGTAWSPHWCVDCNIKRINRIDKQLRQLGWMQGNSR